MPYFENRGATIYYEEKGEGYPLFFLHGASWDMRQWERQKEHFSNRYRVITVDTRGHGRSTLPPGEVSPDIFWQDIKALTDHLLIEKAIFCGLSLGGHTALQMAFQAPESVEALILIGTPCTNQFNLYERICVPVNRFCMKLMPMSWIAWSIAAALGNKASREYIKQTVGSLKHDEFVRVWKAATSMESRQGLPQIKCPTLIMIGDRDSLTRHQQPYIHEAIAGSKLVVIQNAHHGTNLDNPQQVEQEMEEFLSSLQRRTDL